MAKEINLSSREWCDLVFEGKNKDFGAYVIRTESTERHNKAVLWTLIGTIIFGLLTFGLVKANQYLEQRKLADQVGQEAIIVDMTPQAEEVREKEVIEPEQIEEKPEEQLMTYRATELQIVEDEMVKPEDKILSQEEQVQSDGFAGSVNNSVGSTDLDNIHEHIVDVVVERIAVDMVNLAAGRYSAFPCPINGFVATDARKMCHIRILPHTSVFTCCAT